MNASDYNRVLKELADNDGELTYSTRFDLAVKAFEHTAGYDGAIANYLGGVPRITTTLTSPAPSMPSS